MATLPAPPARSSDSSIFTTGTGASGEIREVEPCQYLSNIRSPTTNLFTCEKSGIVICIESFFSTIKISGYNNIPAKKNAKCFMTN